MPAEIYDKGPGEKLAINFLRNGAVYPWQAPNFLDVRIGFFLSITDDIADDTITGLSETLACRSVADRFFIGVKTNSTRMPREPACTFIGWSNASRVNGASEPSGDSLLLSSDSGIGTANSNYWRPAVDDGGVGYSGAIIMDGPNVLASAGDGLQIHFAQANIGTGGPAGYAALLGMRIQRDTPNSTVLRVSFKSDVAGHNGELLHSSTPTTDLIRNTLETAWPSTVRQLGPVQVHAAVDALFWYWPFRNSRIRCHSVGIVKVA